ncbi:uncharacterized protein NPIL_375311 [Nephila pilipes]|uniref:RRM domain-containing protein n=1 Tax=Nephila pilipes TaxID=299642 RepID=A0A8X6T6K4_NEPPI|nr:uncharacterized protein NPIL_375311 [Nephila pilipes]
MSFFSYIWNRSSDKIVTLMIDVKEAIPTVQLLLKMFREINICHKPEFPLNMPPRKKRKLSTSLEEVQNKEDLKAITKDKSQDVYVSRKNDAVSKTRKDRKKNFPHGWLKNEINSGISIKISRSFKRRSKLKREQKTTQPLIEKTNPMKSARYLGQFFRGSINFVQVSTLTPIHDIDSILKNIVQYGKVMHIQDHWSLCFRALSDTFNKSITRWTGALVTYRHLEDSQKALDGLFLRSFLNIRPVNIPQHLLTVGYLETRLAVNDNDHVGSSILIQGFSYKVSSEKINHELEHFGEIKSCQWKTRDKIVSYEVTYKFTVEALAAALALDGKVMGRNVLKTKLVMKKREMNLHMMVCGYYC